MDDDNKPKSLGEPESLDNQYEEGIVSEDGSSDANTPPSTSDRPSVSNIANETPKPNDQPVKPPKNSPIKSLKNSFVGFNIYLGFFIVIILIAVGIVVFGIIHNKNTSNNSAVKGQTLTPAQISELSSGNTVLGDTQQNLTIQSNASFTGSVLIQKDLNVAGNIKLGGSLNLPGINVSGTSSINQLETNKLTVSGDTTIAGQLSVGKGLSVSGSSTFNGALSADQITAQSFTLNSDLSLDHHIDAGGITPGRSGGAALGNGGTVSISGSDTAGSITINTGSSTVVGCFVTVTFNSSFNSTPHIVVTPVGASAAGIEYYINRSTTNFSVCTANTPPTGASFGFDYIAFD